MIQCIKRVCVRALFGAILLLAISINGLRYILTNLDLYKTDIVALLSQQLGASVTIASIQGTLNGITPEIVLQDIQVHAEQSHTPAVQLQKIYLRFCIITAIKQSLLEAIQLSVIGAKLSVTRLQSGGISIQGLPSTNDHKQATWLMHGRQYKLIDSEVRWHDKKHHAMPVLLKHLNITLNNDADQHQVFIKTELPEWLGKSLFMGMEFSGDIFVPESINARLFIQGQAIHLEKFMFVDLPFEASLTQGNGNFSLWSQWQGVQITQVHGSVYLRHAMLKHGDNLPFPIDQLTLQFILQQQQQQWHLGIKEAQLRSKNINIELDRLALALELNATGELTHLAINSPQLPLESISKTILINKILPDHLDQQLTAIALEGEVKNLLLLAHPKQKTFAINAQLSGINTQPIDNIPGVQNLNAYIKGSAQQGIMQINSPQLKLDAPRLFNQALNFTHALGEVHWQHTDSWRFSSPLLELNSDHFKTSTKFALTLAHESQPTFISMHNAFNIQDMSTIPQFLPSGIMGKNTAEWLQHAFVGGHIKQGGVLLRGALTDYPFLQHQGVFEVLFDAKDMKLHYAPGWHDIQGVAAEVHFLSNSMNINIYQGQANASIIQNATVSIDSFDNSQYINVLGDIKSSLSHAVTYLMHSPFKTQMQAINDVVDIEGLTDIHVNLKIPLSEQPLQANIAAKIKHAKATITPIGLSITDITGNFLLTEKGVYSQQITANVLGSAFTAELTTTDTAISMKASSTLSITQLAQQFPSPWWRYINGTSDYRVQLDWLNNSEQICTIQLNSNLLGSAIDFPLLSKPIAQPRTLSIKLGMSASGINAFNIVYKNHLALQDKVDIKLKKTALHWQGQINTPIADGDISIPIAFNNKSRISLALKQLNLTTLQKISLENDSAPLIVKNLPSIALKSQKLYWHKRNLGRLELQTKPTDQGLAIERLRIKSVHNSLSLSGLWRQYNQQNFSSISGTFFSDDFGVFLKQAELSSDIFATTAKLQFALKWHAAPHKVSKSILSGSIDTEFANGRILGIEPGLGRVLGALDIWKLGKRLRFDFSDIIGSGLSFSEAKGRFIIKQGSVNTKELMINAMPAKIYISGNTHLLSKQIELQAIVLPRFPIAGTIIGNISNIISKIFVGNEQAGGFIVSLLYKIKGTWEDFTLSRQFNFSH